MPLDHDAASRTEEARAILRANDRGGYTVPSARMYPFQWNWDSPLTAIGWACFDPDRAWQEFETLTSGQWPDGMIPHIVFHAPSDGYYPGPDAWGTSHAPRTSGISQPPVAATCLRRLVDGAADREAALRRARPLIVKLTAWHRWWHETRDPAGSGLVACLHPWETGRDNAVEWDAPLAGVTSRVEVSALRKDILHADPAERPTHDYYNRVMTIVEDGKTVGWNGPAFHARSPFRVCDLGIQSLLLRADEDLAVLAREAALPDIAAALEAWRVRSLAAMTRLWNPATGAFHSLDLLTGRLTESVGIATLLVLHAGAASRDQALTVIETWTRGTATCRFAAPSTLPAIPGFDARRYWRGPVWPFMNRLVADGFTRYGRDDLAERLRTDTRTLIAQSGFREYFDPFTGAGLGGKDFSWTAAAWLVWAGHDAGAAAD